MAGWIAVKVMLWSPDGRRREIVWRDEAPPGVPARRLDWPEFARARGLPALWHPHDDSGGPAVGLFMAQEALEAARRHGRGSPGAEVGGILYGCLYRDATHTAVDVRAAVPALGADGTPVHLTFTAEAWDGVFAERAELAAGLEVVGWYHTHPGLGVFLSGTDRTTHAAFFPQPWHVALVLDPLRGDEGAFLEGCPAALSVYHGRPETVAGSEAAAGTGTAAGTAAMPAPARTAEPEPVPSPGPKPSPTPVHAPAPTPVPAASAPGAPGSPGDSVRRWLAGACAVAALGVALLALAAAGEREG